LISAKVAQARDKGISLINHVSTQGLVIWMAVSPRPLRFFWLAGVGKSGMRKSGYRFFAEIPL